MLDADIDVVTQAEDARYGRDNQRVDFVRVTYFVGKHGPFTARIDKTDDWHEQRDALLNAEAAKIRTQGGVTR